MKNQEGYWVLLMLDRKKGLMSRQQPQLYRFVRETIQGRLQSISPPKISCLMSAVTSTARIKCTTRVSVPCVTALNRISAANHVWRPS